MPEVRAVRVRTRQRRSSSMVACGPTRAGPGRPATTRNSARSVWSSHGCGQSATNLRAGLAGTEAAEPLVVGQVDTRRCRPEPVACDSRALYGNLGAEEGPLLEKRSDARRPTPGERIQH